MQLANDTDSITGTTGDTGLYEEVEARRTRRSSTTLLAKLLELSITYSTFTLGCSLILVLIALEVLALIKFVW